MRQETFIESLTRLGEASREAIVDDVIAFEHMSEPYDSDVKDMRRSIQAQLRRALRQLEKYNIVERVGHSDRWRLVP